MKNVRLSCPLRMVVIKLLGNKNIMINKFEVSIISISEWKSFQIQNMQVSYIALSFACNTSPQQRRIVCPPRTFAFSVFSIDIYYWCLQTSGTKKGFHYPLVYFRIYGYITHCILLMYKRFGRCTCHQLSVFYAFWMLGIPFCNGCFLVHGAICNLQHPS